MIIFTLLTVVAIGFLQTAYAQPTLNSSYNPYVGYTQSQTLCDTLNVTPGPPGAFQNWVFNLTTQFGNSIQYISPTSTTYYADYPNANLATGVPNYYSYYSATATGLEYLGNKSDLSAFIYSDPFKSRKYPLNYNQTFNDSFYGTFEDDNDIATFSGEATITYDAWGTLTINGNVFTNVARLHSVTTNIYESGSAQKTLEVETYEWLKHNSPDVLLTIFYILPSTAFPEGIKSVTTSSELTGIDTELNSFNRVMIPSIISKKTDITLTWLTCEPIGCSWFIYNTVGGLVSSGEVDDRCMNFSIPTSGLISGMYSLILIDNKRQMRTVKPFVVQ